MDTQYKTHSNWKNQDIMRFMYTDLSDNRDKNSLSYDEKIAFWSGEIVEYCEKKEQMIIDQLNLEKAFILNSQSPQCFMKILNFMHRDKHLALVSDYVFKDSNDSWMKWSVDVFIKKPAVWGFKSLVFQPFKSGVNYMLNNGEQEKQDENISYVHVDTMKKLSKKLLEAHKMDENVNKSNQIFTLDELEKRHQHMFRSDSEFRLSIIYLCSIKVCSLTMNEHQVKIVKFLDSPKDTYISAEDISILSNKLQIEKLEKKINTLTNEKIKLTQSAKSVVVENKALASGFLRRKKCIEMKIMDTQSLIENLNNIIDKLDDADHNKSTIAAFTESGKAYVNTMKTSVSADHIHDIMDEINMTMDNTKEVQDVIGQPIYDSYDEDELLEELNNLLVTDTVQEPSTFTPNAADTSTPVKANIVFPEVPREAPSSPPPAPVSDMVPLNSGE